MRPRAESTPPLRKALWASAIATAFAVLALAPATPAVSTDYAMPEIPAGYALPDAYDPEPDDSVPPDDYSPEDEWSGGPVGSPERPALFACVAEGTAFDVAALDAALLPVAADVLREVAPSVVVNPLGPVFNTQCAAYTAGVGDDPSPSEATALASETLRLWDLVLAKPGLAALSVVTDAVKLLTFDTCEEDGPQPFCQWLMEFENDGEEDGEDVDQPDEGDAGVPDDNEA